MSNLVESTSTDLIERVKQRDPLGWQRLTQLYSPLVYSWCRKFSVPQHDAADVMQNVFRSVFSHIDTFRRDAPGYSFRSWLWTVTRNKIGDYMRSNLRHADAVGGTDAHMRLMEVADDLSEQSVSYDGQGKTSLLHVIKVVQAEFEDRTWQAFWRTAIDEIPTQQVAEELGISVNAVRLGKSRVLRRLREELD
jgi:RNA polymerase sigma-70 factor (ECF subfamily)